MNKTFERLHGFVRIKSTGEIKVCLTTTPEAARHYLIETYHSNVQKYKAAGLKVEETESPSMLLPYNNTDMMKAVLTIKAGTSGITIRYQQMNDIIPPGRFRVDDVFSINPVYLNANNPETPSESSQAPVTSNPESQSVMKLEMTAHDKEKLLQTAMAKHKYNQAHPGNDNGDSILAGMTGMTIGEGTFENICNAWSLSTDPMVVERLFAGIYLVSFWGFILTAIDRMPNEKDDQDDSDVPISNETNKIYTVMRIRPADGNIMYVRNFKSYDAAVTHINQDYDNIAELAREKDPAVEIHESHDMMCKTMRIWDSHTIETYEWRIFIDEIFK